MTVILGHFNSLGHANFLNILIQFPPLLGPKKRDNPFKKKERHGVEILCIIPPDVVKTRFLGGHGFHLQTVFKDISVKRFTFLSRITYFRHFVGGLVE